MTPAPKPPDMLGPNIDDDDDEDVDEDEPRKKGSSKGSAKPEPNEEPVTRGKLTYSIDVAGVIVV